jgi:hypothetical protein
MLGILQNRLKKMFLFFSNEDLLCEKRNARENIRFSMGMSWLVLFSPSREENAMELDRWLD